MVLITAMISCFHLVAHSLSAVWPTPLTHPAAQEWGKETTPLYSPATDTAEFEAQAI